MVKGTLRDIFLSPVRGTNGGESPLRLLHVGTGSTSSQIKHMENGTRGLPKFNHDNETAVASADAPHMSECQET